MWLKCKMLQRMEPLACSGSSIIPYCAGPLLFTAGTRGRKQAAEDWMILWLSALFPLMHERPWRLSLRLILVWALCNTGIYSLQKSQQPEGTSSSQPVPSLFTHQLSVACLAAAFHPPLLFLPVDLTPSCNMFLFALYSTNPSLVFHLQFLKFWPFFKCFFFLDY